MITEADVRKVALSLPETVEKPSYGTPGFRVRDKLFARILADGDVLLVWVSDESEKFAMIAAQPKKFYTTAHYDGHPTILVRFRAIGTKELRELLTESWRLRAPARLVRQFDTGS